MSLQLELCSDTDMPRAFAIASEGFRREHGYFETLFPAHDTEVGRAAGAERFLAMKHSDPTATFLKITDPTINKVIGIAKWNIYNGTIPEPVRLSGSFWNSDEEKEYVNSVFAGFMLPRMEAIKTSEGHLVALDILSVDPKHQRRGVGALLTKWGVDVADSMGVETVVESSTQGRGLYEKFNFQLVEEVEVPVAEQWQDRPKQRYYWMKRSKQGEE